MDAVGCCIHIYGGECNEGSVRVPPKVILLMTPENAQDLRARVAANVTLPRDQRLVLLLAWAPHLLLRQVLALTHARVRELVPTLGCPYEEYLQEEGEEGYAFASRKGLPFIKKQPLLDRTRPLGREHAWRILRQVLGSGPGALTRLRAKYPHKCECNEGTMPAPQGFPVP